MVAKSLKRPRRKAKQDRSRETVRAILEAAARVLQEHGYARATTNRVAEVAGVSVGTLYEYFANKDELYDALIAQEIHTIVTAIRSEDLDPNAPIRETLTRAIHLGMSAMRRGPGFMRSLEQVPGAVFRRRLAGARQSILGYIRQLLEARRHELQVSDLDFAAFVVVSAAEGIGANASEDLFGDRLAEEVAVLLILYLTGENPRALPRTREES